MRKISWLLMLGLLSLTGCARQQTPADAGKSQVRVLSPEERKVYESQIHQLKKGLKKGEKVTDRDQMFTLFSMSALAGDTELMDLLIKSGADINSKGNMAKQADSTPTPDKFGHTPLHAAVLEGSIEPVRMLLDHGADPNVRNSNGNTPLYDAVGLDREDLVKLLLKKGADVNMTEGVFGFTPLHSAAAGGNVAITQLLIKRGAQLNVKSKQGIAPLHLAASLDRAGTAELLLKNGADPNIKTAAGTTPLKAANQKNFNKVADLIEKYGGK